MKGRAGLAEDRKWKDARIPKWKQSSFLNPQLSHWEQMTKAGKRLSAISLQVGIQYLTAQHRHSHQDMIRTQGS